MQGNVGGTNLKGRRETWIRLDIACLVPKSPEHAEVCKEEKGDLRGLPALPGLLFCGGQGTANKA